MKEFYIKVENLSVSEKLYKFINNEHIIFLEKNDVTIWKEKINFLLTNKKFYFDLIDRRKNLILSNNTLEIFDERLESLKNL